MDSIKDSVAFWASVVGTFLGLLGAIQSLTWLSAIGGVMLVASIGSLAYARRQRQLVESAVLKVAGRSLDSLNLASLRRRLNRTLFIQETHNTAVIDGENLTLSWRCVGYCRADRETSIEFSIDSDNNVPFDELNCFAYDLQNDPEKRHRIRPILIGPEGISKKIAVPFLAPLEAGQPFSVLLTCELPGCMTAGVDYYTATISFAQDQVSIYTARLTFLHDRPDWLRVYDFHVPGGPFLLKDLRPIRDHDDITEYLDTDQDVPPKLGRIYVFHRTAPLHRYDSRPVAAACHST